MTLHQDGVASGSPDVRNFNWLLSNFVETTAGVTDAVAVSSDGLLMAMSSTLERAGAEQLAAIIAGMTSLAESTARCFALGNLDQVIVAMQEGYLFVSSVSDGSSLGVVADRRCDVGLVGYQMQLLVQRVGAALSPALVAELKESVLQ
ncbi:MAG TPA: roadblock/LC7 domain-containing protein [Acidimicrobiia bacterium]|jgi:predicted regulator of Ras-like GTPase activity (Roadblock/LC7/MglB family)|nr:roadblock/LC7 domain-containing protein [Acidimicrobiia bacterium]